MQDRTRLASEPVAEIIRACLATSGLTADVLDARPSLPAPKPPPATLEQAAAAIGLPALNLLADPRWAWMATVTADVWKTTPFITLILLAGLQTIPADLFEAFRLEGGRPMQALREITLPLLVPYILLSLLFRLAQAFGVFDLIQVLTGGGPAGSTESLALYAYLNAMRFLDFGYSATVMLAGFLLLTALILAGTLLLRSFGLLRSLDR